MWCFLFTRRHLHLEAVFLFLMGQANLELFYSGAVIKTFTVYIIYMCYMCVYVCGHLLRKLRYSDCLRMPVFIMMVW